MRAWRQYRQQVLSCFASVPQASFSPLTGPFKPPASPNRKKQSKKAPGGIVTILGEAVFTSIGREMGSNAQEDRPLAPALRTLPGLFGSEQLSDVLLVFVPEQESGVDGQGGHADAALPQPEHASLQVSVPTDLL